MATFRSRDLPSQSSSDDSDSSDDEKPWKRKCDVQVHNQETFVNPLTGQKPNVKSMKFKVWSNVLTDQTVTGELCNFDIVEQKKSDTLVSRDVESYRVTAEAVKKLYPGSDMSAYKDLDEGDEDGMVTDEESGDEDDGNDFMKLLNSYKKAKDDYEKTPQDLRDKIKNKNNKRKNDLRDRIKKNKSERMNQGGGQGVYTSEAKLQTDVPRAQVTDAADVVLKCLLDTLQEQNEELFTTVLEKIGADKALDLLNKTEDVETAGGMLIKSGIRRRTPGGVFLQLLRSDPVATPELMKELFPPPVRDKEVKNRRKKEARRRKRMAMGKSRDGEMESLLDVQPESMDDRGPPENGGGSSVMEGAQPENGGGSSVMEGAQPADEMSNQTSGAEDGELVSD